MKTDTDASLGRDSKTDPPRAADASATRGDTVRREGLSRALSRCRRRDRARHFRIRAQHFRTFGQREGRGAPEGEPQALRESKAAKRERFRPLLRTDLPMRETPDCCDFLSDELRA